MAEENIEQLSSCILDDDKISLLPPVPDPWLILSVGMNYGQHLAEMDNTPRPKHPAAFIKTRDTLLGSGRSIEVPRQCSDMIDYEGDVIRFWQDVPQCKRARSNGLYCWVYHS